MRDGLQGASISAICAEAGISPGHLYHYFNSKDEIVEAMAEGYLEYVREHFAKMAACGSVVSAIDAEFQRAMERSNSGSHGLLFDMIAEAGRSEKVAATLERNTRAICQLLVELIRKGQRNGEIRADLDPAIVATAIIGVIDAIKMVARRDRKVDLRAVIAMIGAMIKRFIVAE